MKNRREKKACKKEDFTRASWYAGQHYYRLGIRGMASRKPINYTNP